MRFYVNQLPCTAWETQNSETNQARKKSIIKKLHATEAEPWTLTSSSREQFCAEADQLEATHRGLHRFATRHSDEIDIDIGDPIHVQSEADDSWCEGPLVQFFSTPIQSNFLTFCSSSLNLAKKFGR